MSPSPRPLTPGVPLDGLARPEPGSTHLWLLAASEHAPHVEDGRHLLDEQERRRADAFAHAQFRERYLAGHIALRRLLGAYLGQDPRTVELTREACPLCAGPHGRPAVRHDGPPLHYSMSYSADQVLFGFAASPIGVDIEEVPEPSAVDDVAPALHPGEQEELGVLPPGERPVAFGRVWARKEAYLKGTGVGLGEGLAKIFLGTGPLPVQPPGWTLTDLDVGPRYAGCAALEAARSY
jgi:4'-phosphopantetheinyl transferase